MSRVLKIVALILIIAAIGVAAYYVRGLVDNPVPVRTIVVDRGDLVVTVTATTTSTIESENKVSIPSRLNGVIQRLYIEEGDAVAEGGLVAMLDDRDVRAELGRVEAAIEVALSRLSQAETGVGMEKSRTEAALKEAESVLWEAESNLERSELLFKRGLISRQDHNATMSARDVAKSRYDTAKANLSLYGVKLKDAEAAKAAVDEAKAARVAAALKLEYCRITSPLAGVISNLPVEVGESVAFGQTIAEVVDPDDIYVLSTIDEVDAGKLSVGMPVKIHVDATADMLHDGAISRISPIVFGAKQETRTFEVRVRFNKKLPVLKPGMSADIEITSKQMPGILRIPAQAVMERDDSRYVYIIDDDRARAVKVNIGYLSWSDAEILDGIKEGDRVITTPTVAGLADGSKVKEMPAEDD